MPHYDYTKDKAIAEKTEKQVAEVFRRNFKGITKIEFNKDNKYDLLLTYSNGKTLKVEVKEDFTCKRTGNVGLEYFCRGKPSGIDVSQADWLCEKMIGEVLIDGHPKA